MESKNNNYLKYFIITIVILFIVWYWSLKNKSKEGFVSRIHQIYRPYVRHFNINYESFINNYGPTTIITKLRKWKIY